MNVAQDLNRGREVSQEKSMTAKKKILLVDDVKLFIELEKTFFQRKAAFEVLTAGNAKEALEIVQSAQPDLVFMDLYMPEMDGDECCRLIKASAIGENIPIVMVTSAGKEDDKERCLDAGCDEIITKPINRSHFLSVAKKYLEVHERKEPRYAVHVKVAYGQQQDLVLTDYTVNINAGGLFLTSSESMQVGTELFVEINLSGDAQVVRCQAQVAWVNSADKPLKRDLPVGLGLEFMDISIDDAKMIEEYIKQNSLTADW